MKKVEIALLIIILILVGILINYDTLAIWTKKYISQRQFKNSKLFIITNKLYNVFQVIRRFSLVYILKSKFYQFYLAMAIAIIATKIGIYYRSQLQEAIPIWLDKSIGFLIVSAAWEIICVVTKMIDERTNNKQ